MYRLFNEAVRVSENAAIQCASWRGKGDKIKADEAAVNAMRSALSQLPIDGKIVIGEGERDQAPMLYIGEKIGKFADCAKKNKQKLTPENLLEVDIAVDPLEGTELCADFQDNALAVVAFAEKGNFLHAPDVYMQKIAIGAGYPDDIIDIDAEIAHNIKSLADYNKVSVDKINACVLARPRHNDIIENLRLVGCGIKLIRDGDIAASINTLSPKQSGVDIYIGIGGAPEGVLAAAALACRGGQMQARLVTDQQKQIDRAKKMGILDFTKKLYLHDLAKGNIVFCATGVTNGDLLAGVKIDRKSITTESLVMMSIPKMMRKIVTVSPS